MIGAQKNSPKSKTSGFLKTTTWGTLISLSLVVAVLGVSGHLPWTSASQATPVPVAAVSVRPTQPFAAHSIFLGSSSDRTYKGVSTRPGGREQVAKTDVTAQPSVLVASTSRQDNSGLHAAVSSTSSDSGPSAAEDNDSVQQALIAAKLSSDLKQVDPEAPLDVIVQYHQLPSAMDPVAEGLTIKADLPVVSARLLTVKGSDLKSLASNANVTYISPDRQVKGALDHVVTGVNADLAYSNGWNGTGVGIAVVDSGVSTISDLNSDGNYQPSRIVYSQSFVPGDASTSDAYGHGTHVAGILSGNSFNSSVKHYPGVYRGIAPEAKIIDLRVLDASGTGSDSSVISAIQQAISLKSTYNIRVLNLSLGRSVFESYQLDPLCQAVESAWQAGIVVVVSAGNSGQDNTYGTNGYDMIGAPGNDPYVITVGATNLHGSGTQAAQTMTSYSSKGPTAVDHIVKPDLVAPGNQVVSLNAWSNTLVTTYPSLAVYPCNSSGSSCGSQYGAAKYMRLSGTSMATPVVSGTAALLVQKNPSLTPDQVKARLMKSAWKGFSTSTTATDLASGTVYQIEQDVFAVGAGAVDASAALNNTDLAPATYGSAKSPAATYNSVTNTVSIVTDPSTVWNNSVVWGHAVVWGNSLFSASQVKTNSVVWGHTVVWGNSVVWGHSAVGGNSVVWGHTEAGGDN
jgi:serine protease AprX